MSNKIEECLERAGYVLLDGSLLFVKEYHGEDDSLNSHGYPEFSATHCCDDACIRVYKEPNELQMGVIADISDAYLHAYGYCKIEIWESRSRFTLYKALSLYEGACQDLHCREDIGDWDGRTFISIISNYYANVSR